MNDPSIPLMSSSYDDVQPNEGIGFQIRRFVIFTIVCLCDLIVYFQRACPTVVGDEMAHSYGVDVSKLGIFSSMFYYPYAILQPFAGLLADVIEPSYLITGFGLLAALGAVICGLSNNLVVGCIGRFLVGVGSAPIYCPANRTTMNWYPLKYYSKMTGLYVFLAGCGALLAQTPLALLAEAIGWRWCFHTVAIVEAALSLMTLLFVRGNPVAFGYNPVNPSLSRDVSTLSFSEKLHKLGSNLKDVISFPSFWFVAFYSFFSSGAFYNVNGSWGCQYLMDVFDLSKVTSCNVLISLSVGTNLGSLGFPFFSELIHSKKWTVVIATVISILSCVPFVFFPHVLEVWSLSLLFGIFSLTTTSLATTAYPMLTEYFHPSTAGTATGCVNSFAFLSSIPFMPITGLVLDHYGSVPGTEKYAEAGYRYGLWVFNLLALIAALLFIIVAKDPFGVPYRLENEVQTMSAFQ